MHRRVSRLDLLLDKLWVLRGRIKCFFGHHRIARRRCLECGTFLGE